MADNEKAQSPPPEKPVAAEFKPVERAADKQASTGIFESANDCKPAKY